MIVLRKVLPSNKYKHFLKLHCAIYILLCSNPTNELKSTANSLLHEFVEESSILYGKEFLVYNVHSLVHLADDAYKFGSLDNVSAFPFENAMQQLLRYLRGKNDKHLQQVVKKT